MAYKSWKPKGTNYIDIRGITFGKWEIPRHRIGVTYGYRNLYYYIGKLNKITSGYSNVSCLVLYFSNWENYNQAVPAIVTITKNRTLITRLGDGESNSNNWKSIYVYEDTDYYWVFVKAPNYHDNWYYEIIEERNVSDIQKDYRMTETDFNTFISSHNLTLTRFNNNIGYGSNNYYTTENVVGTWIDGKPLYRRTFTFTTVNVDYTFSRYDTKLTNINEIMIDHTHSFVKSSNDNCIYPINGYRASSNETTVFNTVSFWGRMENDKHNFNYSCGTLTKNSQCVLTLEYTKTTD